jgi:hypothetical protein
MKKTFQEYAKQALEESGNRKKKIQKEKFKEINGPKGPEPTRYGDWEIKGITYDF